MQNRRRYYFLKGITKFLSNHKLLKDMIANFTNMAKICINCDSRTHIRNIQTPLCVQHFLGLNNKLLKDIFNIPTFKYYFIPT